MEKHLTSSFSIPKTTTSLESYFYDHKTLNEEIGDESYFCLLDLNGLKFMLRNN